jgi:hypothetical protein
VKDGVVGLKKKNSGCISFSIIISIFINTYPITQHTKTILNVSQSHHTIARKGIISFVSQTVYPFQLDQLS